MKLRLGLVTCALVLALPATSYADAWSSSDPTGDASTTTYSPEPEPCGTVTETPTTEGDIQRLSARHSRRAIVLRLEVTGLTTARRAHTTFDLVTSTRHWLVTVDRFEQRTQVSYFRAPDFTEQDGDECGLYVFSVSPRTCAGATSAIDVAGQAVTASLPRSCFGRPRWVRVGAQISGGQGKAHGFSDRWLPGGFDGDYDRPLVGRRVYAGPRP